MSRLTRLPKSLYAISLVIVFLVYSQRELLLDNNYSSYVDRISVSVQHSSNIPLHDEYKARI